MNKYALIILFFLFLPKAFASLPNGLVMIGFSGDHWYPYEVKQGRWQRVSNIVDPSQVSKHPGGDSYYVKASDGYIYHYAETTLAISDTTHHSYTQLRAHREGVVMVRLVDGKSRDTEIGAIQNEQWLPLVKQASAQFHPFRQGSWLYYANVSCRSPCKPLIQDVWRKNMDTGLSEQLTRLNATSYLHSTDRHHRLGAISSNTKGHYHIALLNLNNQKLRWLTSGAVTDSFPTIVDDSELYFIRRDSQGSGIYRITNLLGTPTEPQKIALPKGVSKVRYLERNYE